MNDEMPAVERLGIQPYRYGHEGLHGYLMPCPVAGAWGEGGKCFTDFPTSSAAVASFNRSLVSECLYCFADTVCNAAPPPLIIVATTQWYAIGSAEADEARGTYNAGFGRGRGSADPAGHDGFGLHIRGPQLNPQRDPRWCGASAQLCCWPAAPPRLSRALHQHAALQTHTAVLTPSSCWTKLVGGGTRIHLGSAPTQTGSTAPSSSVVLKGLPSMGRIHTGATGRSSVR
jgi:hypothetical protein